MCGRYVTATPPEQLAEEFHVDAVKAEPLAPKYNVAPTDDVYAIAISRDGLRQLGTFKWGLVPSWAKDPSIGSRMINARAETVSSKPAFRRLLQKRRCILPADGFYEWQKGEGGPSRPFFVRRRDGEPLAFAGLWQPVRLESGERLETCAILTTAASPLLRPIHSRMPVMLRPDAIDAWLDPTVRTPEFLQTLLEQPLPDAELEAYEVGRAVNSPRHDGPELAERQAAEPPGPAQARLL